MGKPTLPPSTPGKSNKAPTAIALSSIAVSENAEGAQVGIITVDDPNKKETFTFSLSDNRFEIVTNAQGQFVLQLKSGVSLDKVHGTTHRFSGFSQPRQCGLLVFLMFVTGAPPNCGGPGMPQRAIISSRAPSGALHTMGAT
jgi:hypothetical protein